MYGIEPWRAFALSLYAVDQMALDIYYSNPATGRILCHIDRDEYGVDGYFDVRIKRVYQGVEVQAIVEKYYFLDRAKFMELVMSFFYLFDHGLHSGALGPPTSSWVTVFERPSPLRPMLLNVVTIAIILVAGLMLATMLGVDEWGAAIVMLLGSPFVVAILLMAANRTRIGGMISFAFAFVTGIPLGWGAYILTVPVAAWGGVLAMKRGRWQELHDEVIMETKEVSSPSVVDLGFSGGR